MSLKKLHALSCVFFLSKPEMKCFMVLRGFLFHGYLKQYIHWSISSTVSCFFGSDVQWRPFDLYRAATKSSLCSSHLDLLWQAEKKSGMILRNYFSTLNLYGPGSILFSKNLYQRDAVQGDDVKWKCLSRTERWTKQEGFRTHVWRN